MVFQAFKTHEGAFLPERKHDTDVGYDICASLLGESVIIQPGAYRRVHTGIAVAIPVGYFLRLTARSSTQHYVLEGVIDPEYRGEIMVGVLNPTPNPITICHGERIAQLVIHERISVTWEEVGALEYNTPRGTGGFGSTGR